MELLTILLVVLFIIIATVKFKLNPVFSLILAALISGFLLGLTPQQMMVQIGEGFGKTLSGIGLVIAFGSVIGIFLEKTGSTKVLTDTILKWVGLKRSPLAINLAGFIRPFLWVPFFWRRVFGCVWTVGQPTPYGIAIEFRGVRTGCSRSARPSERRQGA